MKFKLYAIITCRVILFLWFFLAIKKNLKIILSSQITHTKKTGDGLCGSQASLPSPDLELLFKRD